MEDDLKLVVDEKTHRLIGIFDKKHSRKFFTGGDIVIDGQLFRGGVLYVKDKYRIWGIEINKEYKDCDIYVSDRKDKKKEEL